MRSGWILLLGLVAFTAFAIRWLNNSSSSMSQDSSKRANSPGDPTGSEPLPQVRPSPESDEPPEPEVRLEPNDLSPALCASRSAHEAYLLLRDSLPEGLEISRRSLFPGHDGRNLWVRQQRLSSTSRTIVLSVAWIEARTGKQSPWEEMAQSESFLDSTSSMQLLGPLWTDKLASIEPVLVASDRAYDQGTASFENEIAVELRHQLPRGALWVRCGRDAPCECRP